MALQIAPFTPPKRQDLTPQNLAALPKMGPPDMVEANMKGIAGMGTAFEGAYARARERGAMDQLSEYYKTHPFATASGVAGVPGVTGVGGMADNPAAGATATSFKGKPEDGLKVYQGLVDRGIEPHVAAGMAGNVYTESRFNTGAVGDKGTALGYAQWRGSRQQGLFAAAQQRGTDWRDPEAQLDHMAAELKGPYAKVYRAAVASGNPGAATAILARGYERPAEWALRKTLGERTGAAQSIFALGQQGGGPAPVAAAPPPGPLPPPRPVQAGAVVGGSVAAPPPVGLPPPDPTPDNVANAKAIMQQPTSDPRLKEWAGTVLRQQPGAAGQVPTANQPAPGANPASLQLPDNTFVIPGTGQQVPAGSGPDRVNAGAPVPQQVVVGEDGNPVPPSPAAAPPPLPPPDPRRVAAQAPANAPAPGAVPAQFRPSGGDSTYAATTDYEGAVRAGLLPPPTGGVPRGPAPGPAGGGPGATGPLPAPAGAAAPAAVPGAGGGAATTPSPAAPAAAPGGGAVGGIAGSPGTFRANEALAIAARGDPQVFAAMLRQYGGDGSGGAGDFALEHDANGNWVRLNKRTGETTPITMPGAAQPGMTILNPGDPERKKYGLPDDGRTWTLDRKTGKLDAVAGNAQPYEQEAGVRKEAMADKEIVKYRSSAIALDQMQKSADAGTGAGDVSLVYQYMKMLDPESAVREGEVALAGQTSSLPQQVVGLYNRLLNGERLSDAQRAQFVNLGGALQQSRFAGVKPQVDFYRNIARSKKIDPDLVINVPDYQYKKWEPPVDPATGKPRAHTGQEPGERRNFQGSSVENPLIVDSKEALATIPKGHKLYVRVPGMGIVEVP